MPFYNTTPLPVTVFTSPTGTGVNPLAILKNESPSQTLFVGLSACTPNTGVPVPPNAELRLPTATKSVYACSNWAAGTAAATAGTGVSTVGTTSWTVASGGMANIPVGTTFLIGLTTGQEALVVATSASTTSITTTTGSLFAHAASEVLYQCVTTPGVLKVQGGTSLPPVASAALPVAAG